MTNDKLIKDNLRLAYRLANKYHKLFGGMFEFDELRSVSLLGLTQAARNYDETRGIAFSTFAYACIKNEILRYYEENRKHLNISLSAIVLEDKVLEDMIESHINDEEKAIKNLEINLLYKYIEKLPETEKVVLINYALQGKTMKEIGNMLGYSDARICEFYYSALNKLRDKFLD